MRRSHELEQRLIAWGDEYGGGKYEHIGYPRQNLLHTLREQGFIPHSRDVPQRAHHSGADEVQDAVEALQRQAQGWLPAQALRCEYMAGEVPIEVKLQRMKRVGSDVSRVRFSQLVRIARIHVAGWLRLPFDDKEADKPQLVHDFALD